MTYRCGLSFPGARRDPAVYCDAPGCVAHVTVGADGRRPPAWFLDGRAVPRWSLERTEHADGSVTRVDLCPFHRATERGKATP